MPVKVCERSLATWAVGAWKIDTPFHAGHAQGGSGNGSIRATCCIKIIDIYIYTHIYLAIYLSVYIHIYGLGFRMRTCIHIKHKLYIYTYTHIPLTIIYIIIHMYMDRLLGYRTSETYTVVSRNRGTPIWTPKTIIFIMGTPP